MQDINFPLYAMRQYDRLETVRHAGVSYKLIHTFKSTYVLDLLGQEPITYQARRVRLLADNTKPVNLYPLSKRFDNLGQMAVSKERLFIDNEGNIIQWKPEKFYNVICRPVETSWQGRGGMWVSTVKGIPTKFQTRSKPTGYIQFVQFVNRHIFFNFVEEPVKATRIKL